MAFNENILKLFSCFQLGEAWGFLLAGELIRLLIEKSMIQKLFIKLKISLTSLSTNLYFIFSGF